MNKNPRNLRHVYVILGTLRGDPATVYDVCGSIQKAIHRMDGLLADRRSRGCLVAWDRHTHQILSTPPISMIRAAYVHGPTKDSLPEEFRIEKHPIR